MRTVDALVESGHRLVCGPDLYLHEIRAFSIAAWTAVYIYLVHMLPSVLATEHVVNLFSGKRHLLLEALSHCEDVGAGLTEEAEGPRTLLVRFLCQEEIRASRAE